MTWTSMQRSSILREYADGQLRAAVASGLLPSLTIPDLVGRADEAFGAKTAIVLGGERVSFSELVRRVDSRAAELVSLGLVGGDAVALVGTNSVDWIVTTLASLTVGATVVPLNTRLTDAEMEWQLDKSRAKFLVARPQCRRRSLEELIRGAADERRLTVATIDGQLAGVPSLGGRDDLHGESMWAPPGPSDLALVMFTSGSTATPKGCMLRHDGIVRNAAQHVDRLDIGLDDVWFSGMPFFHAGGLIFGICSMLVSGATLVAQEVFDAGNALDLIEQEGATYQHGVDTMFVRQMEHPAFDRRRVSSLRSVSSIGSPKLLRRIYETMGVPGVVSKYGMTEGYANLTLCAPDDPLDKRLSTVGRGYVGIEYQIVEPGTARVLKAGSLGEIQVRGSCMVGYLDDEEATRAVIDAEGWLYTGDLGYWDADGYLHYGGRSKEMLKVGGENVSELEIEGVLATHPGVSAVVVTGHPDPDLGEVPVAFYVMRAGAQVTADELAAFARERLAPYKVPSTYLAVDWSEVPITESGKPVKHELRRRVVEFLGSAGRSL